MRRRLMIPVAGCALALLAGCNSQFQDNKFEGGQISLVKGLMSETGANGEYTLLSTPTQMNGAESESLDFSGTIPADGRTAPEVAWNWFQAVSDLPGVTLSGADPSGHPPEEVPVAECGKNYDSADVVKYPAKVPADWSSCSIRFQVTRGGGPVYLAVEFDSKPGDLVTVVAHAAPVRR